MIELSGVSVSYEGAERAALSNIYLEIDYGESVALVGASGSGKTTLLRLLNALVLPTEGRVRVGGLDTSDPSNLWAVRRKVGLIFQNPDNQIVSTTVERELAFGMENLGLNHDEISRRIEDAVDLMRLERLRSRAPHRLSGGEKQRVAIAAVLAMRPECLALDEPTSLLDAAGRAEVWRVLEELSRDVTRTVVHVTQFPEEVALSPRVVALVEGRIVFDGSPRELFSRRAELADWGLARPPAMELAARLNDGGCRVPEDVLTMDELADAAAGGGC